MHLAALLLLLTAPNADVLDLREVLTAVRARSSALAIARANVEAMDARVDGAWTGWKPTLSAVGSVSYSNQEAEFKPLPDELVDFIQSLSPDAPIQRTPPIVVQPAFQASGVLQLTQTLFNITVLRAPGAARSARKAAVANVDALEDELFFQAATIYASLVGLSELEAAARRAVEAAETREKDAALKVEAGTETRLAVTRAATDRVAAQGQQTAVAAQRARLLAALGALMGRDVAFDVKPMTLALQSEDAERRSIRAKRSELEAARRALAMTQMTWLPTLNAEGLLRYTNFDGFGGDPILLQGTVNLVLPLYDGGRRYANEAEAKARVRMAEHAVENEVRIARAFLAEAGASLVAAESEVTQANAQLALAKDGRTLANELAQNGLATSLELTDASLREFQADRNLAQKKLERELAALRVYYASGGSLGVLVNE